MPNLYYDTGMGKWVLSNGAGLPFEILTTATGASSVYGKEMSAGDNLGTDLAAGTATNYVIPADTAVTIDANLTYASAQNVYGIDRDTSVINVNLTGTGKVPAVTMLSNSLLENLTINIQVDAAAIDAANRILFRYVNDCMFRNCRIKFTASPGTPTANQLYVFGTATGLRLLMQDIYWDPTSTGNRVGLLYASYASQTRANSTVSGIYWLSSGNYQYASSSYFIFCYYLCSAYFSNIFAPSASRIYGTNAANGAMTFSSAGVGSGAQITDSVTLENVREFSLSVYNFYTYQIRGFYNTNDGLYFNQTYSVHYSVMVSHAYISTLDVVNFNYAIFDDVLIRGAVSFASGTARFTDCRFDSAIALGCEARFANTFFGSTLAYSGANSAFTGCTFTSTLTLTASKMAFTGCYFIGAVINAATYYYNMFTDCNFTSAINSVFERCSFKGCSFDSTLAASGANASISDSKFTAATSTITLSGNYAKLSNVDLVAATSGTSVFSGASQSIEGFRTPELVTASGANSTYSNCSFGDVATFSGNYSKVTGSVFAALPAISGNDVCFINCDLTVGNPSYTSITGFRLISCLIAGYVVLTTCARCIVNGNTVLSTDGTRSIYIDTCTNCVVVGNSCEDIVEVNAGSGNINEHNGEF